MNTNSINTTQACFCGANCDFSSCCQPYINKEMLVQTAEQLMRSRFSAYALGNAQYIYDTYAKSSQAAQSVENIDDWSKACVWIALKVYPVVNNVNNTTEQFVEFSAFYIINNTLCELREKSRFILEESMSPTITENTEVKEQLSLNAPLKQWRYIDGDIISHSELANIKRNDLCPCNHYPTAWQSKKGKKFKHCCGK
ncbi:YchJ family protein [Candidatus Colwellia aromaticivorans]|uniref:YchJ family protein n=1 Tax=Candidatus Colwellia aromaticivorans TaxID=2267621 RepID=UPI000DF3623B|nr:YchJ family metal-binding protein [Candidatus Colwellia aromaticivorans]